MLNEKRLIQEIEEDAARTQGKPSRLGLTLFLNAMLLVFLGGLYVWLVDGNSAGAFGAVVSLFSASRYFAGYKYRYALFYLREKGNGG